MSSLNNPQKLFHCEKRLPSGHILLGGIMTTFFASTSVDLNSLNEFNILNSSNIGSATFSGGATNIAVVLGNIEIDFTGSFLASGGTPTEGDLSSGTISAIYVKVDGTLSYQILSVSLLGSDLLGYVNDTDPNAWLGNVLFAGDDSIRGSSLADTLIGYGGNDILYGGLGADT